MRLLSVVILVSLLASLGIGVLACVVPATPTPEVTPTPAATVTRTPYVPDFPTPTPPPTPRPGATPVSTNTQTYDATGVVNTVTAWTFDLKKSDIVVLTVKFAGKPGSVVAVGAVGVDAPDGKYAMTPTTVLVGTKALRFQAQLDGKYGLIVSADSPGGVFTITTDIYR